MKGVTTRRKRHEHASLSSLVINRKVFELVRFSFPRFIYYSWCLQRRVTQGQGGKKEEAGKP